METKTLCVDEMFTMKGMEPYDASREDPGAYVERLDSWLHLSNVQEEDKVHVLIRMLDAEQYGTLRKLCGNVRPAKLPYKSCFEKLHSHYRRGSVHEEPLVMLDEPVSHTAAGEDAKRLKLSDASVRRKKQIASEDLRSSKDTSEDERRGNKADKVRTKYISRSIDCEIEVQ